MVEPTGFVRVIVLIRLAYRIRDRAVIITTSLISWRVLRG